jgi:hypothetical protein
METPGKAEKRRSGRVIPVVSEEEVVLVDLGTRPAYLAKLLDFSEGGTLVYLLEADLDAAVGAACFLMLYHQGRVCKIPAKVVRKFGRLIGFDFGELSPDLLRDIQGKLLRIEVEWLRLSHRGRG